MKKVKNLLVVMDRPKQRQLAMQRGITLADQLGARLHLAAFVHHDMYDQKDVFESSQRSAVRDALETERSQWLEERVRSARLDTTQVTTEVVWEKHLHEWVASACEAKRFDLVLKSAHNSKTLVHTPTDWHLLRDCPAPVLVATSSKWPAKARVLAAVDPTRKDQAHKRLNHRVIESALAFAATHDAEVHLGWSVQAPEILADLDILDPDKYRTQLVETMRPRLDELAGKFDIPVERIHTPNGKPGVALSGLAAQLKAELIVIGTTARSGVSAMLVGNTAEKVLEAARCDILTIKP